MEKILVGVPYYRYIDPECEEVQKRHEMHFAHISSVVDTSNAKLDMLIKELIDK